MGHFAVSVVVVLILAAIVTQVRVDDDAFALLLLVFVIPAVALCTSAAMLLKHLRLPKALLTGFAGTAVLIGLLLGYIEVRSEPAPGFDLAEGQNDPAATPSRSDSISSPPPSATELLPSPVPTLRSEGPTERLVQDRLVLQGAQSILMEDWGLRVATNNVYTTFADVLIATDEETCDAMLNVGETVVLSNQLPGEADYSMWYSAVLEEIKDGQATLVWAVGTGRAPAADSSHSCI